MDKNEIKKDLYKSKANAKLMYYDPATGDLQYSVEVFGRIHTFPIHTVRTVKTTKEVMEKGVRVVVEMDTVELTADLKGARFEPEMRGSSLIRWIQQAIDADEFH